MLNCSVSQASKPMLCKWATSAGEGPKVACSRKRPASAAVITLMGMPCDGKGFKVIVIVPELAACEPPMPMPVSNPVLLTVATLVVSLELQVALLVSLRSPSVQCPVAMSCRVVLAPMNMGEGETVTDCKTAGPTVSGSWLLLTVVAPTVREAWILVGPPTAMPFAKPVVLMGATVGIVELHEATAVTSTGLPAMVAVAVYCSVKPFAIELSGDEMAMAVTLPAGTTSTTDLEAKGPLIAVIVTVPAATGVTTPV